MDPEKIENLLKHYVSLRKMFDRGKLGVKLKAAMTVMCRQEGVSISVFYQKLKLRRSI